MPVIKSAKKKLRQDKKRTIRNAKMETVLKDAIKAAKKSPSLTTVRKATSAADKAAKNQIIHKNKAGHIKSSLSKLLSGTGKKSVAEAKAKKAVKKVSKATKASSGKKSPTKKK